jgi:PAS domain S-box-containing protein
VATLNARAIAQRAPPLLAGWPLRRYMALFVAALLVVAGAAAVYVRVQSEQDATQAASADANFAANKAASQIKDALDHIEALSAPLAASPAMDQIFADPSKCGIGFAPVGVFDTGHIDILRLDGSVVCSSRKSTGAPGYQGQAWLNSTAPASVAPTIDTLTGNQVVIIAYPIPGKGVLAWFLDLVPVGPKLSSEFGSGVHQLEFLVTSGDGPAVLARSMDPVRWVGTNVSSTAFARSGSQVNRQDFNGKLRIYGSSPVGRNAWRVYVGADQAAALAAADQLANRDLTIILGGIAIVLLVTFVIYRRITEPIRELNLRVRRAPVGQDGHRPSLRGAAEIVALSTDFDKLMEGMKHELAERLRSEHAARISERNFRALFEGHPQPMWIYDSSTFAFLSVNDAAVQQYGYSRDEFLAMSAKDIRPPEDVPKFLELAANTPSFDRSGPWRHVSKDGSIRQVLITSHAVTFGDREARFVMAEDLTESQRLELELHQSKARSDAEAELSRAKDELVSMVSHELRTPLASLLGFTELLLSRDVTDAKRREFLTVMLQEGRRLTSLINDFLDLQRIGGGHQILNMAPADLGALIKRAIKNSDTASTIPIETRVPDDLPLVLVDSDSILRVLANLLSNATKYSPSGGAIVVGAGVAGSMVEVYVQDHGLGIPRESLPHLTETFYRVDQPDRRDIKGTGLGLAISKKVVEAHGGAIGARSEGLGKGSLFHFTIPIARDRAKSGDVLIVEDDAGFAHLLEVELASKGLSSVWAADAETAEQLTQHRMTRAVVLDLMLPGLQGEDFLNRLRGSHGPGIPVVVVTVKNLGPEQSIALQRAGVTAVLRKGAGTAEAAATLIAQAVVPELVSR